MINRSTPGGNADNTHKYQMKTEPVRTSFLEQLSHLKHPDPACLTHPEDVTSPPHSLH